MTAELREAVALAHWGPVTVKKEEEEEEGFVGQVSSQQVRSENIKVWAPGEDPQTCLPVSEQEEKVISGRGEGREDCTWFQEGPCPSASTPRVLFPGEGSLVFCNLIETYYCIDVDIQYFL